MPDVCVCAFSQLPYDVTAEQALQHDAVRDRIKHSMQCLQDTTDYFLSAILQSVDKIPYVFSAMFQLRLLLLANKCLDVLFS